MTLSRGMVVRSNTISDVILNGSSIGQPARQHAEDYVRGISVVGRMDAVLVEDNTIHNGGMYINASHFCMPPDWTTTVDCSGCSLSGLTVRGNVVTGHPLPLSPNGTIPQPPPPLPPPAPPRPPPPPQLDASMYNVVWESASIEPGVALGIGPGSSSLLTVNGSMPIGNGDLTASAFPNTKRGSILLWLAKQDAIADCENTSNPRPQFPGLFLTEID